MNTKKKLGVIAAAMVVATQIGFATTAVAAPNATDARIVLQLLQNKDISRLRTYLEAKPLAMAGDHPLAVALAQFYAQATTPNTFGVIRVNDSALKNIWSAARMY
ncbi:MAG: hypothetical protein IKE14_05005 [Loktanella sp.]|nr:hypothetical protein [Loktanella sp.]